MRPRRSHFVGVACVLFLALRAFALDPASLKPQGYVNDVAGVIGDEYRTSIEQYCHAVETATGAQIAVVTVNTLDNAPIEEFTNKLYRQWGVGQKGKNEGLMLFVAVQDRKNRIEVGYGLEPVITDGFTGSTLRQMRPLLSAGQYGPAILGALETLGQKIAEAHGTSIDLTGVAQPAHARRPRSSSTGIPIGAIIFLIIVVALLSRGGRGGGGLLAGMILGNVLGRGGSGFGGGGFGGFDGGGGGGGFGGFGGGDSGGGGASSSW